MDRLTTRNSDGSITIESATKIAGAFERLAEYEDTGLTPEVCKNYKIFEDEAISKGVSFKRIVELMDAEAEGRLIVLPCKVWDTVYTIEVFYEGGEWKKRRRDRKFNVSDVEKIGKWVFLSREEAEAALSKDGEQYDCN